MSTELKCLWEILIPTIRNDGRPFKLRYHKIWDAKVKEISNGLTILAVAKGQWVFDNKTYNERMIPVRIIATREEINKIIDYTLKYYEQIAVLAYRISDDVIIKYSNVV